ncbi:uncharacterized protein TNCV_2235061 [Trichonephila clavipes]|nr:uncharacterized protein TNCV_2235061 [Trichonephila clavipes]
MRQIGKGFSGAFKLCSTLKLPRLTKTAYKNQEAKLLKVVQEVAEESMIKAATEIVEKQQNLSSDIVKCGISVDGTWQRRGYTSMNGCVAAMSVDTGKVLDIEVICRPTVQHALSTSHIEQKNDHEIFALHPLERVKTESDLCTGNDRFAIRERTRIALNDCVGPATDVQNDEALSFSVPRDQNPETRILYHVWLRDTSDECIDAPAIHTNRLRALE